MTRKANPVANAYTEDQLVEQPAIGLSAELGWSTVSVLEETFGAPSPGLAATLSHPMGEGRRLGARRRARWCWCPGCARRGSG